MIKKIDKSKEKKTIEANVQAAIDKDNKSKSVRKITDAPDLDLFKQISVDIWKPEPGEFVLGIYDGSILFESPKKKGDKDVNVHFIIDNESGDRLSFIPGMMFDKVIDESGVKEGDTIFAAYKRQDQTSDNNPVNVWDIRIKKA